MLSSWWIPKSERGREVANILRDVGYEVRNADVMGRYVCNLPMFNQLPLDVRRSIAYAIDPDRAYIEESRKLEMAENIRRDLGLDPDTAEKFASQAEVDWLR